MSKDLLAKTREINKLLQRSAGYPVDFREMCKVLNKVLSANVYVASRKGKVLGFSLIEGYDCDIVFDEVLDERRFLKQYNDMLLDHNESVANIDLEPTKCVLDNEKDCIYPNSYTAIIPINGGGERLGTLVLARFDSEFGDEDLILAEYSATVVGMEIIRSKSDEIEEEARKKAVVQLALGTLSFSELEAVDHILQELDGTEGLLVASKVADRVGITRSVIVNALRKFESAGIIESRSLGMKGTYIKVLNDKLLDELKKVRS